MSEITYTSVVERVTTGMFQEHPLAHDRARRAQGGTPTATAVFVLKHACEACVFTG